MTVLIMYKFLSFADITITHLWTSCGKEFSPNKILFKSYKDLSVFHPKALSAPSSGKIVQLVWSIFPRTRISFRVLHSLPCGQVGITWYLLYDLFSSWYGESVRQAADTRIIYIYCKCQNGRPPWERSRKNNQQVKRNQNNIHQKVSVDLLFHW